MTETSVPPPIPTPPPGRRRSRHSLRRVVTMWIAVTVALLAVVMFVLFLPAIFPCGCGAPITPATTPLALLEKPS